jgi:DNA-binding NarL/FixJ family response regulator
MSLALCDPHGMFVDALAVALADRGHEIAGTASDVGRISELVDRWSPTVCVLGLGVQETEALAAAAAIRSGDLTTLPPAGRAAARELFEF